jgi:hypothetical protein
MEAHNLRPKAVFKSSSKVLSIVAFAMALAGISSPISNFAAGLPVAPEAGGAGIQAALDALPDGGEVLLSPGDYLVRSPIILRHDHQTLRGAGVATILRLADEADCPVVVLGAPTDTPKPIHDVRLAALFIDGNRQHQQKEVWRWLGNGDGVYNNGVDVWNVDGAAVEGVVCCHCRSGGLVAAARTRRLTVRDFTAFDNQFDGLACCLTEESDFSRLNLHDNLAAGLSLDLNFNHNVIRDSVMTSNDLGIFMRQSCDNVFQGLTIEKSRHHGVFMAQTFVSTPAGVQPAPGSECVRNTFDNLRVAHCAGKAFLIHDATCTSNILSGGQFTDNGEGGLSQAAPNLITLRVAHQP